MDPSNKEMSAAAPPPGAEWPPSSPGHASAEAAPATAEAAPAPAETAPAPPSQPPGGQASGMIPLPLPNPTPAAGQGSSTPAVQGTNLQTNDDSDLIEKEWVNKAKQIVERTRSDPHKQSEELTLFKADYLKKRYGKTIKVSQ